MLFINLTLKSLENPFRPVLYTNIPLFLAWFHASYEFKIKSEIKIHVDMIIMSYWGLNLKLSIYKKCQIYANVSTIPISPPRVNWHSSRQWNPSKKIEDNSLRTVKKKKEKWELKKEKGRKKQVRINESKTKKKEKNRVYELVHLKQKTENRKKKDNMKQKIENRQKENNNEKKKQEKREKEKKSRRRTKRN